MIFSLSRSVEHNVDTEWDSGVLLGSDIAALQGVNGREFARQTKVENLRRLALHLS